MKSRNPQLLGLCFIALLLFPTHHSFGQRGIATGFKGWLGATCQLKIDKRWDVKLSAQVRNKYAPQEMLEFGRFFTEFETSYNPRFAKWLKPLGLNVGLRYIGAHKREFINYFRLHIDLSYQIEIARLKATYRFRFQMRDALRSKPAFYTSSWVKDYRNLLHVKYNFKRWKLDPEIWVELFYHNEIGALNGFNNFRVGIRTTYDIDKHHSLGFRYFIERELRYFRPETTHILGLSYKYKFKLKKKKKGKK